jgi:hypothetical protein
LKWDGKLMPSKAWFYGTYCEVYGWLAALNQRQSLDGRTLNMHIGPIWRADAG